MQPPSIPIPEMFSFNASLCEIPSSGSDGSKLRIRCAIVRRQTMVDEFVGSEVLPGLVHDGNEYPVCARVTAHAHFDGAGVAVVQPDAYGAHVL